MAKRGGLWLACGLVLLLMQRNSAGGPYDLVPRGDWSYDVLARWAARGLVDAGYLRAAREFHGDEPLTREAMSDLVMSIALHPERLPRGDQALLEQLIHELAPEIRRARQDPEALVQKANQAARTLQVNDTTTITRGTGYGLARLGVRSDDGGTVRGVYRGAAVASIDPNLLVALSATNERQLRSEDPKAFPILENYVVKWRTGAAEWELGKTGRRWGPGWNGTMLLSDNAPAVFQLDGKVRFSLGFLGHDYTFEQFAGMVDDLGGRRYMAARRLSRPFGRRAGASISEAIKTSSTRDFPLALILPFYLYNHVAFTDEEKARTVNYLAGADFWYAPRDSVRLYTDFVVDDITAPFGFGSYSVPRKVGMQFGLHLPHLNAGRTDVRVEYAVTDGEKPGSSLHEGGTYIHRVPSLSWFHDDLPIGHPMGQNRRGPFVRLRHRFGRRFTAIGEWEDEQQWRATPVVGDRRRAMLYGAYDLKPDRSVALHLERTGGALGRDTLFEVQGSYSF
jgi:hypothetical protein